MLGIDLPKQQAYSPQTHRGHNISVIPYRRHSYVSPMMHTIFKQCPRAKINSYSVIVLMLMMFSSFFSPLQSIFVPKVFAAGETISGFVYEDINGNGTFDAATESGVSPSSVALYSDDFLTVIGSTLTSGGNFTFDSDNAAAITSGTNYWVSISPPAWTSPLPTEGAYYTHITALGDGEHRVMPTNTGWYHQNIFAGTTFYDTDHNGIRGLSEPVIHNISVAIENSSHVAIYGPFPTSGSYILAGGVIPEGTYYLHYSNYPTSYVFTTPNVGGDDTIDSDVISDSQIVINVTYGVEFANLDAGLYRSDPLVGDTVFNDLDHNGVQGGAGEVGISGVNVDVFNRDTSTSLGSTSTDPSGNYQLALPVPACVENSSWTVGLVSTSNCTASTSGGYYQFSFTTDITCSLNGTRVLFTGASGTVLYNQKCGAGGTLTNSTTYTITTAAEDGTGLATLNLTNIDNPIFTGSVYNITITYINVELHFTAPAGYTFTTEHAALGTVDTDSDVNGSGSTGPLAIFPGELVDNIDAGLYESTPPSPTTAHLTMTKNVDNRHPQTSTNVTYTITVTNSGPASGSGILINDDLPTGTLFSSASGSGTYISSTGEWTIPTLADGSTAVLHIIALVTATGGTITNTAEIISAASTDSSDIYGDGIDQGDLKTASFTVNTNTGETGGGGSIGSGVYFNSHGVTLYAPPLDGNSGSSSHVITSSALPIRTIKPCLVIGGSPSLNFTDVANNPDIAFLTTITFVGTKTNLIHGYGNNSFGPHHALTRFELLKIATGSNCMGSSGGNGGSDTPNTTFSDVPKDTSELSVVVGNAYAHGIIHGVNGKFYPNAPVSQAEMLKMIIAASPYFQDGKPLTTLPVTIKGLTDDSFIQYLELAKKLGLFSLSSDQNFPQNNIVNRENMAETLTKFIHALQGSVVTS